MIVAGIAGLAVLRIRRAAAWLGSLPGRARHRMQVRKAQREYIEALERPWKR
jgi:hypothetical protein